ncbi:MAG: DUF309 domain-containing protein [Verrucomicrobia bacterium]|nr:DUF309 domain-containing protein [Verrucomicrobiota bacterium]
MSKRERMARYIRAHGPRGSYPPEYELFFALFNAGDYFEAHDVLEQLWLDCRNSNAIFYKGLIQIAGGFVHLRKHFLRPEHPTDGKRLAPACRLLVLAASNIRTFRPEHMGLDVKKLCAMCRKLAREIEASGFQTNPWHPQARPIVNLSVSKSPTLQ